jgi:hypothetical protein
MVLVIGHGFHKRPEFDYLIDCISRGTRGITCYLPSKENLLDSELRFMCVEVVVNYFKVIS